MMRLTKFNMAISLRTAMTLESASRPSLLLRADEVIE